MTININFQGAEIKNSKILSNTTTTSIISTEGEIHLKSYHTFTDEQIAYANSINILDLARAKGLELKKVGRSYTVENMGGLFINEDGHRWNCFKDEQGGGPIQFLRYIDKKTWLQAVSELVANQFDLVPQRVVVAQEKIPFELPKKNDTFKHMFAYLIQKRGVDKEVINYFVNAKKLYENDKKNCVFVGYDDNNIPAFASFRSTSSAKLRGCIAGADKQYTFNKEGTNGNLFVFESAIDLMSYLTLVKQSGGERISVDPNHYISLDGVLGMGLDHYLIQHNEIDHIYFCLDNDEAGNKASLHLGKLYKDKYQLSRYCPRDGYKDWNDMLCGLKGHENTNHFDAEQEKQLER